MKAVVSTQLLIGILTFLILILVGRRKVFKHPKYLALFFSFYFLDNLAITLTNHYSWLQIVPNRLWEGFLLWGWSGKMYSITITLILLYFARSVLPTGEVGITAQQNTGSLIPSMAVVSIVTVWASIAGFCSPKGNLDLGTLAYLAVLPGINEELIYRGALPACLEKLFPQKWVLVSAKMGWSLMIPTLMFGLLHGLWLDDQLGLHIEIVLIRNALLSGFVFAWLRARTGSLILPVVAHGALDFFLFLGRMI